MLLTFLLESLFIFLSLYPELLQAKVEGGSYKHRCLSKDAWGRVLTLLLSSYVT